MWGGGLLLLQLGPPEAGPAPALAMTKPATRLLGSPAIGSLGHKPRRRKSHEPPEYGEEDDRQREAVGSHGEARSGGRAAVRGRQVARVAVYEQQSVSHAGSGAKSAGGPL